MKAFASQTNRGCGLGGDEDAHLRHPASSSKRRRVSEGLFLQLVPCCIVVRTNPIQNPRSRTNVLQRVTGFSFKPCFSTIPRYNVARLPLLGEYFWTYAKAVYLQVQLRTRFNQNMSAVVYGFPRAFRELYNSCAGLSRRLEWTTL